jgi:hypothetical protein
MGARSSCWASAISSRLPHSPHTPNDGGVPPQLPGIAAKRRSLGRHTRRRGCATSTGGVAGHTSAGHAAGLGGSADDGQPLSRTGDIVGSEPTAWLLIGLALLVIGLALLANWRPAHRLVDLAVLALAPLTVVAVASVQFTPVWVARYLLVVLAPLAILAAVATVGQVDVPRYPGATEQGGLHRRSGTAWSSRLGGLGHVVRTHGMRALCLLCILAVLAATAYPGHRTVRGTTAKNGADYRGIPKIIERNQRPGDGMVYEVRSRAMRAGMDYYLRQYPSWPRDVLQRRPAAEAGQLRADKYPDAAARWPGWTGCGSSSAAIATIPRPASRRCARCCARSTTASESGI